MPFTLCPAFLWRFITRERVKGALRKHVGNFQPAPPAPDHFHGLFFNSKTGAAENQSIAAMPLFRLKIDETLTADRVRPQGRGRRGRPAGMQARPRPERQTE